MVVGYMVGEPLLTEGTLEGPNEGIYNGKRKGTDRRVKMDDIMRR